MRYEASTKVELKHPPGGLTLAKTRPPRTTLPLPAKSNLRISEELLDCRELRRISGRGHPTKAGFERFGRLQTDLRGLPDGRGRSG